MRQSISGSGDRFLVTGALGCLGAWVIRSLLDEHAVPVGLDLSTDLRRLRLICTDEELEHVTILNGDITEPGVVSRAIAEHGVSYVVHCAALQVPFVRADPYRGAKVNVLGTVNVFEAVKEHRTQVQGLAYASSAAVFGPAEQYQGALVDNSPQHPEGSLYGVFKRTNELMARVYAAQDGLVATGLRPFVVYGPGRDQGMTSGPTVAMLAAVAGVAYHVTFRGPMYFNFAGDAAVAFIAAARHHGAEPLVLNIPGTRATVEELVETIGEIIPAAQGTITMSDVELASPSAVDASGAQALLGLGDPTPFREGVTRTIDILGKGLNRGLLQAPVG